jgi:hypothetical protein
MAATGVPIGLAEVLLLFSPTFLFFFGKKLLVNFDTSCAEIIFSVAVLPGILHVIVLVYHSIS